MPRSRASDFRAIGGRDGGEDQATGDAASQLTGDRVGGRAGAKADDHARHDQVGGGDC